MEKDRIYSNLDIELSDAKDLLGFLSSLCGDKANLLLQIEATQLQTFAEVVSKKIDSARTLSDELYKELCR